MTHIIAIGGGSSAGKTSIAKLLGGPIISLDNFYKPLSENEKENVNKINWDHPSRFNFDKYIECIQKIKKGEIVKIPKYSHITHSLEGYDEYDFSKEPVVICEGIFIGYLPEERDLYDLFVFVDVDADLRLIRRLKRDTSERGRSTESILYQWKNYVKKGYDDFIDQIKQYADVILPRGKTNLICINLIKQRINTLKQKGN